MPPRWNHNIHYHPHLLALAPARRALDVGCGEGLLSRALAARCESVVGLDPHAPSISLARSTSSADNLEFVCDDLFTADLEPASFDLVVAVAMLHHVDAGAALRRFRHLLAPGGRIGIIGLARARWPADLPHQLAGAAATRVHKHILGKRLWSHDAPIVWPPPLDYRETRAIAARELPGSRFRRRVLWRYTLTWTSPA